MFFPVNGDPYRTHPDTNIDQVVLQLPMTGENNSTTFTDVSPTPKTITRYGDTKILTAQSKWGQGSGYFDGSGDYLSIAHNTELSLIDEFTIEFWIYTGVASKTKTVCAKGYNSGINVHWSISISSSGYVFAALGRSQTTMSRNTILGATDIANSAWRHIAFVGTTTQLMIFVDGVSDAAAVTRTVTPLDSTYPLRVGDYGENADYITGYLQDFRITKGVARYTANFTPPASPLPSRLPEYPVQRIQQPSFHTVARLGL